MGTIIRDAAKKRGGARRDRTADLYNAIVALSQLSYGPTGAREPTEYIKECQERGQSTAARRGTATTETTDLLKAQITDKVSKIAIFHPQRSPTSRQFS